MSWDNHDACMKRRGARYRSDLRREVLRRADDFEVVTVRPTDRPTDEEVKQGYALYEQAFVPGAETQRAQAAVFDVFRDGQKLGVRRASTLPSRRRRKLVAVMFSHFEGQAYHAMSLPHLAPSA